MIDIMLFIFKEFHAFFLFDEKIDIRYTWNI